VRSAEASDVKLPLTEAILLQKSLCGVTKVHWHCLLGILLDDKDATAMLSLTMGKERWLYTVNLSKHQLAWLCNNGDHSPALLSMQCGGWTLEMRLGRVLTHSQKLGEGNRWGL
jgi:hypothetical protein